MTQATLGNKSFLLARFPLGQKTRSLQAWDSADEYLTTYVEQEFPEAKNIVIYNDSFGALNCYFHNKVLSSVSDSYIAHQATLYNLEKNNLVDGQVNQSDCLSQIPKETDLVILKVPKNTGLLTHQLALLSQAVSPGTPIIAAGKTKDIHNSTSAAFEKVIGPTKTSLAIKKSRLVISRLEKKPSASPYPISWPLDNKESQQYNFTISNHASVFSRDSLDIGARFFMNFLPQSKKVKHIIDLGCGNGVIGLMVLAKCPNAQLTFVDESHMAVQSANLNIQQNLSSKLSQCTFMQNDCLTNFTANSQDIVLSNPPFHQEQAVTDHIAWQMFVDARRVLKTGGELRIIGNRHLDYHGKLERIFGNCKLLGSNKKFVVLSSIKEA